MTWWNWLTQEPDEELAAMESVAAQLAAPIHSVPPSPLALFEPPVAASAKPGVRRRVPSSTACEITSLLASVAAREEGHDATEHPHAISSVLDTSSAVISPVTRKVSDASSPSLAFRLALGRSSAFTPLSGASSPCSAASTPCLSDHHSTTSSAHTSPRGSFSVVVPTALASALVTPRTASSVIHSAATRVRVLRRVRSDTDDLTLEQYLEREAQKLDPKVALSQSLPSLPSPSSFACAASDGTSRASNNSSPSAFQHHSVLSPFTRFRPIAPAASRSCASSTAPLQGSTVPQQSPSVAITVCDPSAASSAPACFPTAQPSCTDPLSVATNGVVVFDASKYSTLGASDAVASAKQASTRHWNWLSLALLLALLGLFAWAFLPDFIDLPSSIEYEVHSDYAAAAGDPVFEGDRASVLDSFASSRLWAVLTGDSA